MEKLADVADVIASSVEARKTFEYYLACYLFNAYGYLRSYGARERARQWTERIVSGSPACKRLNAETYATIARAYDWTLEYMAAHA